MHVHVFQNRQPTMDSKMAAPESQPSHPVIARGARQRYQKLNIKHGLFIELFVQQLRITF